MDDNVMYAWQVTDCSGVVHFTCARKEVADYLRDWCEAYEYNLFVNTSQSLIGVYPHMIQTMESRLDKFYVSETEVIL